MKISLLNTHSLTEEPQKGYVEDSYGKSLSVISIILLLLVQSNKHDINKILKCRERERVKGKMVR